MELRYLFILLLPVVLMGCIPEDVPVTPFDRGGVEVRQVAIGANYERQIFFDLESDSVVETMPVTAWDIALVTVSDTPSLILNSAKVMGVCDMGPVDFSTPVTSPRTLDWRYDEPSGNLDSTAFGAWWSGEEGDDVWSSRRHLYIVDRGYDASGRAQGYVRVMIEGADAGGCTVRTAALDGTGERVVTLPRDASRSISALLLGADARAVDGEPTRERWDILFTRYTHLFRDPDVIAYAVTGVLLNRRMTLVAVDTTRAFAEITSADVAGYQLEDRRDGVGYGWKIYDLNAGLYTVNPGIAYILRTSTGFYYKLHFTDFYNDAGEKGYPTFKYQKL